MKPDVEGRNCNYADLLTLEELAELFPEMYRGLMAERSRLKIRRNLPLIMDRLKFEANKEYVNKILKGA